MATSEFSVLVRSYDDSKTTIIEVTSLIRHLNLNLAWRMIRKIDLDVSLLRGLEQENAFQYASIRPIYQTAELAMNKASI